MMNAFKKKAKRCCSTEYERVVREVATCEMESDSSEKRHACYRRAAKISGRRARACIAGA